MKKLHGIDLPEGISNLEAMEIVQKQKEGQRADNGTGDGQRVRSILSEEQLAFIMAEFSLSPEFIAAMSSDEIDELYDLIGDIEVEEIVACEGKELSERGRMAVSIVTAIGRELYMSLYPEE